MATYVEKCPACGGDALERGGYYESAVDHANLTSSNMHAIHRAIRKYYLALDNREHGGVAMDKAFKEIEGVLGTRWRQGEMKDMLENHPKLAESLKWKEA